jgi:CheY-like chemotaxis protein
LNLLSNAVKFTESGHVVLTAGSEGATGLNVTVTDTGIGLTPEQQGRLFQSFSQADVSTSRRYGGTGLGLAISRRLAGLMGGTVSVESPVADGPGSRFHLTVQVGVDQPAQPTTTDPVLAGHAVLVTEPNPVLREILVTRLRGWGCEVRPEGDGPDGHPAPDVQLLDAASADAATVSAGGSAGALVLMSTVSRRDTAARFGWEVPAGAGWVTKPVKPAVLLAALRAALDADVPSAVIEVPAARSAEVLADRHPLRLLLVEDNSLNRTLAVALLARLGYPADVATTGSEAVAATAARPYDVVLMDVQMPDMDGLEATRRIVAATTGPRPWIVALTANVMDADREACAAAGMDDFLAKPIRPQELADVLERSPMRDDSAVDWATLRTHVQGMAGMDDHELERDLAEDFVTGAPVLLAAIDTGLETGDPTEVRRSAHTLKSHAALFGATRLETLSRRLEELAAASAPGHEMAAVAHALRAETDRVRDQLATARATET